MVWIPPHLGSRPKNPDLADMWDDVESHGFKITRAAWPDGFAWNQYGCVLLTSRRHRSRHKKRLQEFFMLCLAQFGVPCYSWSKEDGYRKIYPSHKTLTITPLPSKPRKTGQPDPMKGKT